MLGGFTDQPFDLRAGQHVMLRDFLDAKRTQDGARGRIEQPVQRVKQDVGYIERINDPLRHRLRLPDCQGLRHLLADHDVQRRKHKKSGQERGQMERRFRHAERPQQGVEQGRDRWLADPAETEGCHGDAELAAGEIGLDVAHDVAHQPRPELTAFHHRLDAIAAAFHQREFRRNEEPVGSKQQQGEQYLQESRTHCGPMDLPNLSDSIIRIPSTRHCLRMSESKLLQGHYDVGSTLDHVHDFESNRPKIMTVIDSNILERDVGGKPHHTFPHPAL
jgi:hypothetical protein